MSMFGYVKTPQGGYKRSVEDVLSKSDVEKIVDDKIKNIDLPTTTVNDDDGDGTTKINNMLVNKERSKLYSIYYFTTGDITNLHVKNVGVDKTFTVTGKGGKNTAVTDRQIVTEVTNWYNCSRFSISEDDSDDTLFLTAGGKSNGGITYTRVKNNGYMKDCMLIQEGKNMKTMYGFGYYDSYSFYFSFRAIKPADEIFYYNHENVLGIYSEKDTGDSDSGVNQLYVIVYDKKIRVVNSMADSWYVVSVVKNGKKCDVWLNGKKIGSVNLDGAAKPRVLKPGIMISGAAYVSDIVLFDDVHDEDLVKDMNYLFTNI